MIRHFLTHSLHTLFLNRVAASLTGMPLLNLPSPNKMSHSHSNSLHTMTHHTHIDGHTYYNNIPIYHDQASETEPKMATELSRMTAHNIMGCPLKSEPHVITQRVFVQFTSLHHLTGMPLLNLPLPTRCHIPIPTVEFLIPILLPLEHMVGVTKFSLLLHKQLLLS